MTFTIIGVSVGVGVMVAEGVADDVAVNGDVAVGGIVAGRVKVMNGAATFNSPKTYDAVSLLGSNAIAFDNNGRICLACASEIGSPCGDQPNNLSAA